MLKKYCVYAILSSLSMFASSRVRATIVLQFGDSISLGTQPHLEAMLPNHTIVHAGLPDISPPNNNQSTRQWLTIDDGETKPRFERMLDAVPNHSIIIANIGIHDMRVDNPDSFGTSPTVYEANLNTIFNKLDQQNVPIIWVTTTPIPCDHHPGIVDCNVQSAYRHAELQAVNSRGYTVVDVYASMVDDFESKYQVFPTNLHLNTDGYRFIAEQIAPVVEAVAIPESKAFLSLGLLSIWGIARHVLPWSQAKIGFTGVDSQQY